jgi:sterol 3beta-glucosyltransferase
MKVTMIAVGSRGDVQPYVALGIGLKAAGHDVVLATHDDFRDFVGEHGLEFASIGGSPRAMMQTEQGRRMATSGTNPWPFVLTFRRIFSEFADEVIDTTLRITENADAMIYSIFALAAYDVAEKRGIPALPAMLQPMTRTRYFPLQPHPRGKRSRLWNMMTFVGAQQMFGQAFKGLNNRWRHERLGLPPLPFAGMYSLLDTRRVPALYGYSPTVVPKPPDWGSHLHVTGYWFLDRSQDWKPPAKLVEFLEAGPPPVYVGFGSMTTRNPRQATEMVVRALQRTGQRGVLLSGWGALHTEDLPEDVFCIDSAPHDWLFPRMAAVVHHAGAGTTGAALRSGVPSFGVPFFGDQHFWADRATRLGVGPRYIPQERMTADRLASAMRQAVTDPEMKRRAAMVGKRIGAERGVENAVEAFEREVAGWKTRGA